MADMNRFPQDETRVRRRLAALGLGLALALGGAAQAQEQGGESAAPAAPQLSEEQRAQLEEFQKTRAEMIQVQQELAQIQQAAVQARPELLQQQEQLARLMISEMERQGHRPKDDIAELQALQGKLRSSETPEADRQALMMRLQSKAQAFQQAQQQAMQKAELQEAQSKLVAAITGAMREDEPRTEELLRQLQEKQRKLIEIRNEAMGQQ